MSKALARQKNKDLSLAPPKTNIKSQMSPCKPSTEGSGDRRSPGFSGQPVSLRFSEGCLEVYRGCSQETKAKGSSETNKWKCIFGSRMEFTV